MLELLHINDNNLLLQNAQRTIRSQGYAWFNDAKLVFDVDLISDADQGARTPVSLCRLSPQQINNRYWQQCEQSAIPANAAGMRHAADLVWKHLSAFKNHYALDQLVLVVPSHYREANLQLLLGIAKSCGLEVLGLANKAIVALRDRGLADGQYCHIDVQLHQTVCTLVNVENGQLSLGDVDVLSEVGIHLMQEALLKGLQSNFIQNDRFDPLHDAATEQQLFDQLAGIAKNIDTDGKASVGLEHQGRLHSTIIDSKEWRKLLTPFSDRLSQINTSVDQRFIDLNAAFDGITLSALVDVGIVDVGIVDLSGAPTTLIDDLVQSDRSSGVIYQTDIASLAPNTKTFHAATQGAKDAERVDLANAELDNVGLDQSDDRATHILHLGVATLLEHAEVHFDKGLLSVVASSNANVQQLLATGKLTVLNDEGSTNLYANDRIGSDFAEGVLSVIRVQ